jgi:hypothetical protein
MPKTRRVVGGWYFGKGYKCSDIYCRECRRPFTPKDITERFCSRLCAKRWSRAFHAAMKESKKWVDITLEEIGL